VKIYLANLTTISDAGQDHISLLAICLRTHLLELNDIRMEKRSVVDKLPLNILINLCKRKAKVNVS
jgi:hypothetical protein